MKERDGGRLAAAQDVLARKCDELQTALAAKQSDCAAAAVRASQLQEALTVSRQNHQATQVCLGNGSLRLAMKLEWLFQMSVQQACPSAIHWQNVLDVCISILLQERLKALEQQERLRALEQHAQLQSFGNMSMACACLCVLLQERLKALEQQKDTNVRSSSHASNQLLAVQVGRREGCRWKLGVNLLAPISGRYG